MKGMVLSPKKEEKLKAYVEKARIRGFSLSVIEKKLRQAGYASADIEQLTKAFASPHLDTQQPSGKKWIRAIAMLLVVIFISSAAWYFFQPAELAECAHEECFIEAAQKCQPALLFTELDGSTTKHETADCAYSRTMEKISGQEPLEVYELFAGKSLHCEYQQGMFNADWVRSMSLGLDQCEGELKEAIDAIINAQEELAIR